MKSLFIFFVLFLAVQPASAHKTLCPVPLKDKNSMEMDYKGLLEITQMGTQDIQNQINQLQRQLKKSKALEAKWAAKVQSTDKKNWEVDYTGLLEVTQMGTRDIQNQINQLQRQLKKSKALETKWAAKIRGLERG